MTGDETDEQETAERVAARRLLRAIESGKAIMMRPEVECISRAVLAPFSSGRPGVEPPDGAGVVCLDTAFVWRCACGRSHFVTADAVPDAEAVELRALAVQRGEVPEGADLQFATAPVVVVCEPGCGGIYRTSE